MVIDDKRNIFKPSSSNEEQSIPTREIIHQVYEALEEKGYNPLAYRFFCLQSHYRKSLVFSWENLDNAANAYNKLTAKIASLDREGEIDKEVFDRCKAYFTDALDNDLNTSLAVTALYDVLKESTNGATKIALIKDFDSVLCLGLIAEADRILAEKAAESVDKEWVEDLIAKRALAKANKDYAGADAIRAQLLENGIVLQDTPTGTKWSVK